jgi:NDP-sugar pyrophosphorylase family protein
MNSDLFTDIDFEDLYLQVTDQQASMGIASFPYTVNIPYAIFTEAHRSVSGFEEKPTKTSYANAGIYLFAREWVDKIPKNAFYNVTDLLQMMIDTQVKIIHNPIVGYWIDIGRREDYENAQEIVKHLKRDPHSS